MEKIPNLLIKSTSPYLRQHAYNPVEWREWNPETLTLAHAKNKLLIVSIGYSACHWCHVMEHESFENQAIAEVMNQHFINIKIDREERPDLDQVYMYAIQLMRGQGGWPLNCICLPDGRPIYGGTYFKPQDWTNILLQLAKLWAENPEEAVKYADKLTQGIRQVEEIIPVETTSDFDFASVKDLIQSWKNLFDMTYGGHRQAPKFPMPVNWQFLLQYSAVAQDNAVHIFTLLSLQKMALGGIYDHLGGGFARYSVDERWHIPHFEKMLYDNAQLVSLYAEAYLYSKIPLFKQVVIETLVFIHQELSSPQGLFYAALDADSEGKEGKYYVWDAAEIREILPDSKLFMEYYGISESGNWAEENCNVLMAVSDKEDFAQAHDMDLEILTAYLENAKHQLLEHRNKRVKPGLDDKIITGWNALMIAAYADAYKILDDEKYLQSALSAAELLCADAQNGLNRIYQKPEIKAFLEDYALLIAALIKVYEITFEERWLHQAVGFCEQVIENFGDSDNDLFYFTSKNAESIIARKQEITDNVIPSSNSVMAHNLQKLSLILERSDYEKRYQAMLKNTQKLYKSYGSAYAHWASLLLQETQGCYQITLGGKVDKSTHQQLFKYYLPFKIYMGNTPSQIPLLKDKHSVETKIYICKNKTCSLPLNDIPAAFQAIDHLENHGLS